MQADSCTARFICTVLEARTFSIVTPLRNAENRRTVSVINDVPDYSLLNECEVGGKACVVHDWTHNRYSIVMPLRSQRAEEARVCLLRKRGYPPMRKTARPRAIEAWRNRTETNKKRCSPVQGVRMTTLWTVPIAQKDRQLQWFCFPHTGLLACSCNSDKSSCTHLKGYCAKPHLNQRLTTGMISCN